MSEKRISIIIPAYNSAAFIGETLENILDENFEGTEIIVVNDGSADNTGDVVRSYAEKNDSILLFEKENGGVSSARNFGIEKATGKYVCFQDADDLYAPGTLRAFWETAEETDADVLICRLRNFNENGPGKFNAFSDKLASMRTIDPFDLQLLWNFLVSNKLYRRDRLVESGVRFPSSRYSEEGAFFMSYVFTLPKIAGCFGATALYRRHSREQGLSVSQTVSLSLAKSFCDSMDIIYEKALPLAEKMNDEIREEYLGEILYKKAYVLSSQFYRPMWHGDDECVAFCAKEIGSLLEKMPENRRAAMLATDADLHLEKIFSTKAEVAENPNVSVILAPTRKDCRAFIVDLFDQISPMFALFVPESIAERGDVPEELKDCPNVFILPDRGFVKAAKRKAKGKVIVFRKPVRLDLRMIRLVYKLKGKLPPKLVDLFFPILAKTINFALVRKIVK